MYSGTNKTALASQSQISDAMMRMIQTTPYAEITISALCKEAGISRQTFYTLFYTRENVLLSVLNAPDGIVSKLAADADAGMAAFCRSVSIGLCGNRQLIRTLVNNKLDCLLYESLCEALESNEGFPKDADDFSRPYAAGFCAGGICGVARRYAREGCTADADTLEALLLRLFRGEMTTQD